MGTNRITNRLNSEKSKDSVNKDTFIGINLESSQTIIPTNDINRVINVAEQFNNERQGCTYYRLMGTILPLMSNPLFNLTNSSLLDKDTLAGFNSYDFLDYSYPKDNDINDDGDFNYSESITEYLKEKDGWFGYFDADVTKESLCNFNDMEPKRERFSFMDDLNSFKNKKRVKNWEITVTYPKSSDKTHKMVSGGLLLVENQDTKIATKNMTAIGTPCFHNLEIGNTVRISGTVGFNGDHEVVGLGIGDGEDISYYFVIDIENNGSLNNESRMKKVLNGVESEYYFRKFRKIKTKNGNMIETDDYDSYQLAFSENIFNDKIVQYAFNEDLDIAGLTDNLGRPLSELFLTVIKTDSDELFSKVSSGIETPYMSKFNTSHLNGYLRDIPAINKIHNGINSPFQSYKPLETNIKINNNNNLIGNNEFYGDLVEYNKSTLNEVILSEVTHRFNTVNRESQSPLNYFLGPDETKQINLGPRQEGYIYHPHRSFKIKQFSNYIEEGDSFTEGIPNYAVDMGDGRIIWRDLLEIGFNDVEGKILNYPFVNNSHHIYKTDTFQLKRQDQFGFWGLYYSQFPSDVNGVRITDKYIINKRDTDDC